MRVVIGNGPDGLRAAASRSMDGEPVLLLQEAQTAHGRTAPTIPEGTGRMALSPEQRVDVEAVIGPLVDAPDVRRAILARGQLRSLPLSKIAVAQLFEANALPEVSRRWLERRVRNALTPLTGEGREERSYRDWVVRRLGEPVFAHLYSDYAAARFGAPAGDLSCSVARVVHGDAAASARAGLVAGGGPAESLDAAIARIEQSGGEIRTGVDIRGLELKAGRVVGVKTGDGAIKLDGALWIARPPAQLAAWLGDALDPRLHHDARALQTADAVQIALRGGPPDLPDEVHLVGERASFYRVVTTYGGQRCAVFHATVPSGEPLDAGLPARVAADAARLGLHGFEEAGAVVERLVDHVPVWTERCHARLRRLVLAWEGFGIVTVGRQGTYTPMDIGQEVVWALTMGATDQPDQREGLRVLLEPPVLQPDLRASVSRFVAR